MPKLKLEASIIPTLYCPPTKAKETYFDTAITGFVIEVRANGGSTYSLRYKDEYGRQRQYKIANTADITFAEAKKEAIRVKPACRSEKIRRRSAKPIAAFLPCRSCRNAISSSPRRTRRAMISTSDICASTCCPGLASCTSISSGRTRSWSG